MKDTVYINITASAIIKVIALLIAFAGVYYLRDLVIILLVAVVLASAIEPLVIFLARYRIPRVVSVLSLFVLLITVVTAVAFIFIPPLAEDIARFVKTLPALLNTIQLFGKDLGFRELSLQLQTVSQDISGEQIVTVIKNALFGQSGFFATTSVVINGIVNTVLTFVIAIYLALEEKGVQKFLRLLAPVSYESYIEHIWSRAQRKISLWMQAQFLLSFIVSILIYVPMLILGMPYATLLAIFVFFGELIPVVGLTIATVPALLLAWVHGGVHLLGYVAVVYFVVSQIEGNILYPKIMNRAVGVPSVLIIISMLIGANIAGFWGLVLAVPITAIIMEILSDYDKKKRLAI